MTNNNSKGNEPWQHPNPETKHAQLEAWPDGVMVSLSFADVPADEVHDLYSLALAVGHPFTVHVTHPVKDEDDEI